jgi:hypothetical protein
LPSQLACAETNFNQTAHRTIPFFCRVSSQHTGRLWKADQENFLITKYMKQIRVMLWLFLRVRYFFGVKKRRNKKENPAFGL